LITAPPALGAQSLSHWTTREIPDHYFNGESTRCVKAKSHTLEIRVKPGSISGDSTKYEAGRGKIWLDRQARAT